ncbi:MAG: tripartite tricarboxylate transporter TctB family protein [Alphaproteobacteria bacterium]|nr:MAG: tripartite tricarboxylate transporter TctB family protein [Alphaproteobacteria bacterium]
MIRGLSDRVAGAILFALAIWFWWQAGSYAVAFGDPAGPSLFPRVVAVPMALFSLVLILRPDPDPVWLRWPAAARQGAALAILLVYPLMLRPLGFPAATFLAVLPLALLFGARVMPAVVTALAIAGGLFVIFDTLFGLPLPLGPLSG